MQVKNNKIKIVSQGVAQEAQVIFFEGDNGLCQYDYSCGIITNDGIDYSTNCYWLEIRNYCSNNTKRFCFSYDVWFNNYVGNHFCVTNVSSW